MDIVYVIGTGSKWQNNELRYSLRSIDKFGQNLGQVYIVGDELPSFVSPEAVRFLRVKDITKDMPALNVAYKINRLFDNTDVDTFLLSSDDHFFHQPVDFDQWPLHYKGKAMPDTGARGVGDRRYTQTMIDTRRFMERHNLDLRYWEGHTNKLYMRSMWDMLITGAMGEDFLNCFENTPYGICCNSPMEAMIHKHHPEIEVRYRKDIKLKHLNTDEDWALIGSDASFSIYNSAISSGVSDYLQHLFPSRSRFEFR